MSYEDASASRAARLLANIESIAAYTAAHDELRAAHHFLYDLKSRPDAQPRFVVMGLNPGETARDWERSPKPTEETSRFDFHQRYEKNGSALRWATLATYYLDNADYVLAELFFWSSRDLTHFRERFGTTLAASPHLTFCRDMNLALINAYAPEAVVVPGLSAAGLCAKLYGLNGGEPVYLGPVRVASIYTDGLRPWIFTKHWTGSRGLSNEQKSAIRDAVRSARSDAITLSSEPTTTVPVSATHLETHRRLVDDKLPSCESQVRQEFLRLESIISPLSSNTKDEASGPGLKFMKSGRSWICRLHPKHEHIVIAFPNDMREQVRATGRLIEGREDAAWLNHAPGDDKAQVEDLIRHASRS